MLKGTLIHPEILVAIGAAGHGSKILIADGNYPAATTLGDNAELIHLNLTPGKLTCTEVLEALCAAVPIEAAAVMATLKEGPYAMASDPPIWAEFRKILKKAGYPNKLEQIERFEFYDAAAEPDVCLTIQTGEQRIYANLLLTIGVVMP
jgi:L-fucose mutarotase